MSYQNFPEELRSLKQWVCWKLEEKNGKKTKVPYSVLGFHASSKNPETWTTFDECFKNLDRFTGLGFCFSSGVVGIDLDNCFNDDKTLKPWAREVLSQFDTYTEISPSGSGLHIILLSDVDLTELPGAGPNGDGGRQVSIDNGASKIECYSRGRFFTVTGEVFENRNTLRDCDILSWHRNTFPPIVQSEPTETIKTQIPPRTPTTDLPDDDTILKVMFRSRGGEKLERLYFHGSQQGEDESRNDMSMAGALMFYCCNDAETAKRLMLGSKLNRDKWNREDYLSRTLSKATRVDVMKWQKRNESLIVGPNGFPLDNIENIRITLEQDSEYQNKITTNGDSGRMELSGKELQDGDVLAITAYLQRKYTFLSKVKRASVFDAIALIAFRNITHPRADFVKSLVWDKVPRIDSWLTKVCYTPDDELHRAIASNFVKGMVRRITSPGCKFDEVLVLSGPQGCGKSTVMETWGGGQGPGPGCGWHAGTTLDSGNKDMFLLFKSKVIIEFTEGAVLSRKSASELKSIISDRYDTYRTPYGRLDNTVPRSCIFAMTTNHDNYLHDETGNRRFLPVKVLATKEKMCDSSWLAENREQLLAEAWYRVDTLKETSHSYPWHLLKAEQESAQKWDEYDEVIELWYESLSDSEKEKGISGLQVWQEVIHREEEQSVIPTMTRRDQDWIAEILRRRLKMEKRIKRIGNIVQKRWFKEE